MIKFKAWLQSNWLLPVVVLCGLGLRLWTVPRGHNYDHDSFMIVAELVDQGKNVYAATLRYNYGPIWSHVLHLIFLLASKDLVVFRYLLSALLSLVDLSIFVILHQKLGRLRAYLFFLNPISIVISGYHNQFDNAALLIGMLSVILIADHYDQPVTRRKFLGLLTLGLSLATKHILFAFPLWLAIKQKGFLQKIIVLLTPVFIFLLSFVPYWRDGRQGILQNVFLYKSYNNEYFYQLFVPNLLRTLLTSALVWIILLVVFAVVFRQRTSFDSLLCYTCVLVAFAPSITNQYLAIPMTFVVAALNPFTLAYLLVGTVFLLFDYNGLHFFRQELASINLSGIFYPILVVLLCLGFIYSLWSQPVFTFVNKLWVKIKIRWGRENQV